MGYELHRCLTTEGRIFIPGRSEVDFSEPGTIVRCIRAIQPTLVVNAAAYTAVDRAESETELARAVNEVAAGVLAEASLSVGAALIHYSTDYVFDGNKAGPYTEDNVPNPINVYGRTKLGGERAIQAVGGPHLILRTSWLYGPRRENFMLRILELALTREEIRVVSDQVGAPTWTRTVANALLRIISLAGSITALPEYLARTRGIYHLSAGGSTSRFGFAQAIADEYSRRAVGVLKVKRWIPVATEEFPKPAARPKNSVLSGRKIAERFGISTDDWRADLRKVVNDLPLPSSTDPDLA